MADLQKMMAIAEDSMFASRIQEVLTKDAIWLARNGPTMLTDYLFLGSNADAHDVEKLKSLGITHVINCAGKSTDNTDIYVNEPEIWIYHAFNAEDNDQYQILQHLPETESIIKHARQYGGRVLLHCEMGVNRSCALCIAHIMRQFQVNLMEVFETMKRLRGICVVNTGFQMQLIRFAREEGLLYAREAPRRY